MSRRSLDDVMSPHPLTSALSLTRSTCLIHPATRQVMAPGSKVWPFFVDHPQIGRTWIGTKSAYPGHQTQELTMKTNDHIEQDTRGSETTRLLSMTDGEETMRPGTERGVAPIMISRIPRATRGGRRRGNVATRYNKLLVRKTDLRQAGKTDESDLVQAAINVGVMLTWNKMEVLAVVERLEDHVRGGMQGVLSTRMMEVVGEIKRLGFKGELKELRDVRETFKGQFYGGVVDIEPGRQTKFRAPGLLMLIQAAMNAAFLRGVESAAEEREDFDVGVFEARSVLYFRTPNKICGEERSYLLQMSRLGTRDSQVKRIAACPGIERAIREEEKKAVVNGVRSQVKEGRELIKLASKLFSRAGGELDESNGTPGKSVTWTAAKNLSDEGFLVLEYVYRRRIGFPILLGDEMTGEEEEEEDEETDERESETRTIDEEDTVTVRGGSYDALRASREQPSLVITLKYRNG